MRIIMWIFTHIELYFICRVSHSRIEVCESGTTYKMCPLCDDIDVCHYWYLSDVCVYTQLSYLFDHLGTVLYAVFVSFWCEFFFYV